MKTLLLHEKKILAYSKLFFIFILFSSCSQSRNLVYFSDLQESTVYRANITNSNELRIQPDDILDITVSTLSAEFNTQFNTGVLLTAGSTNSITPSKAIDGFIVDKSGFVSFPAQTIAKLKLAGLTKEEAKERITTEIKKQVRGTPIVNIKYLNFRITVMGEVTRPNTFTISNDKINILEAISLAGDVTIYGKKDNILIIREKGGLRNISRINLNSKEALNSPYFYLQQNDVIVIEPDKSKVSQTMATTNRNYVYMLTAVTSIVTLIISRLL